MNADSIRPSLPGDDDSWEDLARDLLGVEIDQPAAAADVALVEEELPYPESSLVPAAKAAETHGAEVEAGVEDAASAADDDEVPESNVEDVQVVAEDESSGESDSYWDALKDWDWGSEGDLSRSTS